MKRPQLQFPTPQTVLLIIAAATAVLTWLIPAGQFDRLSYDPEKNQFTQSGNEKEVPFPADQATLDSLGLKIRLEKFTGGDISKPVAIPGTYRRVESRPQGLGALIQSPLKGTVDAIEVILFVLILGGCLGIVNLSGAFDAGLAWVAEKLKGREVWLIVIICCMIAAGGTTFGLAEETIAFYPILVPVFLAAGYDALVVVAVIYMGSAMGSMASTVNPFCNIIASNAAGINWTLGLNGRLFMLGAGMLICLWYIIRYAERVKKNPARSLVFDQKEEHERMFLHVSKNGTVAFSLRSKLILFVFASCFLVMILGVSVLGWWFLEMTTVFFAGAILIGVLARIKEKPFVEAFLKGANDLLGVALIIGLARGVTVLMDDGRISDTLLYYSSQAVEGMPKSLFINAMMYLYAGLSFFISSTSGMAVLTMPIMAPLADVVGIGRETVVNAYMYGLGLFNFINPTSMILASLAMVNVGFDKWLKFSIPLLLLLALLSMAVLTVEGYR